MKTRFDQQGFTTALEVRRGQQGLREAARAIGISASTLSRVENGKDPDLTTLLALCDWLERSPDDFLLRDAGGRAAHLAQLRNRAEHQAVRATEAIRRGDRVGAREHVRACAQALEELEDFGP